MSNVKGSQAMTFNTGRGYSPEGQTIEVQEVGKDDFGDIVVRFQDITRGIKGEMVVWEFTKQAVMNAYDAGRYVNY